jgi:hypothetical protein
LIATGYHHEVRPSVSALVCDLIQEEIIIMLNKIPVVLAATLIVLAGGAIVDSVSAATAIEYGLIAAFIDP